ncbi:Cysteine-rich and transmembrane domain-containing protein 1 [Anabarilius grahami]|uniref:Cysteine-rich and transmembrane domain-containing protein 1 n=1 Tax=Anabarilius grahami TaxID=495550 RepID=A0A3N0YP74_ANAGA|nr:Cysteine-rich and transmembrane domain-containing protein 1 [Anabarilius grahami]
MNYEQPPPYTGPGPAAPGYPPPTAPGYPPQGYPAQPYQGYPVNTDQPNPGYPNYPPGPPGSYPVQPGYQGYPQPPYGGPMYGEPPKNTGQTGGFWGPGMFNCMLDGSVLLLSLGHVDLE